MRKFCKNQKTDIYRFKHHLCNVYRYISQSNRLNVTANSSDMEKGYKNLLKINTKMMFISFYQNTFYSDSNNVNTCILKEEMPTNQQRECYLSMFSFCYVTIFHLLNYIVLVSQHANCNYVLTLRQAKKV